MVMKVALITMVASITVVTRVFRFWKYTWVRDSPFYIRYNRLYRLEREKDYLIIDRIDHGQWRWNWSRPNLGARNSAELLDMLFEISSAEINEVEDTCVWSLDTDGTFYIKDARCIIDSKILPSLAPSTVLDKNIPRKQIIALLHQELSMIVLGSLNYFLGISVARDSFGMFLSQRKYATEILVRAHMAHLSALKRILRYVRGTLDHRLHLFSSSTASLVAYSDADWAGCPTTRVRLQFEAEYRGVANVVAETFWLRNLLRELHTHLSFATRVYCDNVSAVYLTSNPVQHQCTKHIEIDIHFIRDLVAAGQVRVLQVPSRYHVGTNHPTQRLKLHVSSASPLPKSYTAAFNDPNWQNDMSNGSTYLEGIDVDETFSLVLKLDTLWTVLSLATSRHWPVHQLDVKNAFLHCDLSETVYMHQPPRCQDYAHLDYVCLLQRSLYGLKQALQAWFHDLQLILLVLGLIIVDQIIALLHQELSMIVLGSLNYFLGISVARDSFGMFLSQRKYATEILVRAHMAHLSALKRILRYVRGTLDHRLHLFSSSTASLVAYSDADWAGCPTTRVRLQFEAEYRGVANVVAETFWLRNLLRELHTHLSFATRVYCDNVSAVYLTSNPVQHQCTKHIEIDIHFIRDLVAAGQVRVLQVPSRYQYADIFTKGLSLALFKKICINLSV
uniref:Ribonuclease H-like domain-containing protein n=1 Tax=Tanacetum cinerariifolium TaxID=118510 RepID=A0A6L2MYT6_TANCI|nr:ribonuclease H-like domain-containing protein [Tanacetum cinerariifolium]